MIHFLPKRLCWFSEVPDGAYEAAEPPQKTEPKSQQELAKLAQDVEQSKQTSETAQEAREDGSQEMVQKTLEREEKNVRAMAKLEGSNPTEGLIKMKLVEKPPTAAYLQQTDRPELRDQFIALQDITRQGVREALKSA